MSIKIDIYILKHKVPNLSGRAESLALPERATTLFPQPLKPALVSPHGGTAKAGQSHALMQRKPNSIVRNRSLGWCQQAVVGNCQRYATVRVSVTVSGPESW